MHKDLYRQFLWHLRYAESLFDVFNNFDEKILKSVVAHIAKKCAMSELYRVLKPVVGVALLTVPIFNLPTTFEVRLSRQIESRKIYC